MAFNVALAVGVAGRAAPLAFAVGTVALAVVGLSIVSFARRVAHAGSAYAYIASEFGPRAGFVAGWALMLTYFAYSTMTAVLTGSFISAALANYKIVVHGFWIALSIVAILLAITLAYRDMRLAARLMLFLEGASVLAITALGVKVLDRVAAKGGLSAAPFVPDPRFGLSGVGYAIVFAIMSFAGFEGATTLGEETNEPRRAIPIAVMGTVILTGLFYVFASYMQVVGFGLGNLNTLAHDTTPLNTLALKFASREFATILDLAAAVSAFSCVLGSLSAASRMLFALGRAGLAPGVGVVHQRHGTPGTAVLSIGVFATAVIVLCAPEVGPSSYFEAAATIGTLSLIPVYLGITTAEAAHGFRARKAVWAVLGVAGALILLWPLYNSIFPVPAFPNSLWPYVVIVWLAIGIGVVRLRPAIVRATSYSPEPNPATTHNSEVVWRKDT